MQAQQQKQIPLRDDKKGESNDRQHRLGEWRGRSRASRCPRRASAVVVDAFEAEEAGARAKFFFNAEQLVVLGDAVGARAEPVLICPAPVATAKSAMKVSSVSPERWEMTDGVAIAAARVRWLRRFR